MQLPQFLSLILPILTIPLPQVKKTPKRTVLSRLPKGTISLPSVSSALDCCDKFYFIYLLYIIYILFIYLLLFILFIRCLFFPTSLGLPDSATNWHGTKVSGRYCSCYQPNVLQPLAVYTDDMCTSILLFLNILRLYSTSCRSYYGFSATFTMTEKSPAQGQAVSEHVVLSVGILRGGPENVTSWFWCAFHPDVFTFFFSL